MLRFVKRAVARALLASARLGGARRDHLAIFVPASGGSLGDQALTDATAGVVAAMGYRPLLVRLGEWTPIEVRPASDHLALFGYGLGGALAMRRIARTCDHALIIGADTVDGVYGQDKVAFWGRTLRRLSSAGLGTRFAGFSVSETPRESLLKQVAALDGTGFYLRDPVSLARFTAATGRNAVLAADLAFNLEPEIASDAGRAAADWTAAERASGKLIFGFNISSHVAENADENLLPSLAADLAEWCEAHPEYSCLFIPHDMRGEGRGDAGLLARLLAALPPGVAERCHLPGDSLTAWDVKALCGELAFVFTGRMHIAIAAMGRGTPAAAAAYQGKFEGLYRHFGLDPAPLCLSPDQLSQRGGLRGALEVLRERAPQMRAQIETVLPEVKALVAANFTGIEDRRRDAR